MNSRNQTTKSPYDIEPFVVGRQDYEKAVGYLREKAGYDFDEVMRGISTEELLAAPLGPSPECLSIDAIGDYVEAQQSSITTHLQPAEHHIATCAACASNVAIYREAASGADAVAERFLEAEHELEAAFLLELQPAIADPLEARQRGLPHRTMLAGDGRDHR